MPVWRGKPLESGASSGRDERKRAFPPLTGWAYAVPLTAFKFRFFPMGKSGAGETVLLAQSKLLNHGLVPPGIVGLKVVEQTPPLAHQHEQTAA